MDRVTAAWDMPLSEHTPLEEEALVEQLVVWARAEVDQVYKSKHNAYNVFTKAAIVQTCDNTSGRPDLFYLCQLPELIMWILSFPQHAKWAHVRRILQLAHQKQPLRRPASSDDEHWIPETIQARSRRVRRRYFDDE